MKFFLIILIFFYESAYSAYSGPFLSMESGIMIGNYSPRMNIRSTFSNYYENIIVGLGLSITLKEIQSIKSVYGEAGYCLIPEDPLKLDLKLQTGIETSGKNLAGLIGITSNIDYYLTKKLYFTSSIGIYSGLSVFMLLITGIKIPL